MSPLEWPSDGPSPDLAEPLLLLWPLVIGITSVLAVSESEMSTFLRGYLTVVIFAAVAGGLLLSVLGVGKLIRPVRPQADKYLTYESGVDPVGDDWAEVPIRYYVFALLFVMFDVEVVFIFPWATRLETYGWFGAAHMSIFILLLSLGILYGWRKKVLQWI
ncbi:NADH-quinone oxidoreductase subunit NuoA [soil metagenome]